jgi:hypothetical protein
VDPDACDGDDTTALMDSGKAGDKMSADLRAMLLPQGHANKAGHKVRADLVSSLTTRPEHGP